MFQLAHNPDLKSVVDKGKLTVLTIYPDSDLEVWQEHLTVLPGWWVNGYDQHCTINEEVLYDIRAIPSLYLFDNDKRVILKDAEKRDIEIWLRNHL